MKKHILYLPIIGFLLMGLQACNKELSALPENAKVDGNTITEEITAKGALNGVYYRFANVDESRNITGWKINERLPSEFSGYLTYGYGTGANSPESNYTIGSSSTFWLYGYQIVNAANGVIKGVQDLDETSISKEARDSILGEAYFLRAYGDFKLLSYYGQWFDATSKYGILLREEPSTLTGIPGTRSTVADSYESILNDLDKAIAQAPRQNKKYYATKWAAMALKMRVLICRGQQADYEALINLADQLLQQGPYALESQAKDLFLTKGLTSSEVILGIQPQPNQSAYYYNRSRQYYPGASSLYSAAPAFFQLLEGDPRQAWMVGSYRSEYANYFFTKYIAEGTSPTEVTETSYAIRLTEVYLLKAEAILRSGGNLETAKQLIKEVEIKNGVENFDKLNALQQASDLLVYTFEETVKCLLAEDGQEWQALLRLPFDKVKEYRPSITSNVQYILPVPESEFLYNAEFGEQNPGYSKEY